MTRARRIIINIKNNIPLIIAMEETEDKLVRTVNDLLTTYDLPCYLLEGIVDKIHRRLKDEAKKELIAVKNEYVRQCVENQKTEGESEKCS